MEGASSLESASFVHHRIVLLAPDTCSINKRRGVSISRRRLWGHNIYQNDSTSKKMLSHGHGLAWCGKLTCFKRSSLVPRKESQGCCNGPRPGAPFLKCSNGKCKDLLEFGKDRSRGILRHEKTSTMNELNRVTNRTQESVARKYLPSIPSVLYCKNMLEICWKSPASHVRCVTLLR